MIYKSLYRTYRPQSFAEVVGQKHIVTALSNALKRNKVAHAYLFCGPRGIGKTTIAKLFAKAVNCQNPQEAPCGHCPTCVSMSAPNHPDIIEMDAASNNGVEEIREIVDKVKYAPVEGKYKIYIIDEVHMLTQSAFNALLKTLEEPPQHVIFILATTDPQKVIPTVISRTQRFDFTRANIAEITKLLKEVTNKEEIAIEPEAIELIAELADGGFRDGLSILEQVVAYAEKTITTDTITAVYRLARIEELQEYLQHLINGDIKAAYLSLDKFEEGSVDYRRLIQDLIELSKATVIINLTNDPQFVPGRYRESAKALVQENNPHLFLEFVDEFLKVQYEARFSGLYQSYLEVSTLRLCQSQSFVESRKEEAYELVKKETEEEVIIETKKAETVTPIEPEPSKEAESKENDPVTQNRNKSPKGYPENDEDLTKTLVDLMVLGDRELREKESEAWHKMNDLALDPQYRKVAILLKNSEIKIASEKFVVVSLIRPEQVNVLNQPSNQELIQETMKKVVGTKKGVLAVTNTELMKAIKVFLQFQENDTLPSETEAKQSLKLFELPEKVETEIVDPEALLKEMLGDLLEIKDE